VTGHPSDRAIRRRLGVVVVLLALVQVANNLLPYVGGRDDSCQTMFSGLDIGPEHNNHRLMPHRLMGDLWVYYLDLEVGIEPAPTGRAADLAAWLRMPEVQHNAEAVRVAVRQLCDAGHRVQIRARTRYDETPLVRADACADPRFSAPHSFIPVRLYDSHIPLPWVSSEEPP